MLYIHFLHNKHKAGRDLMLSQPIFVPLQNKNVF